MREDPFDLIGDFKPDVEPLNGRSNFAKNRIYFFFEFREIIERKIDGVSQPWFLPHNLALTIF